MNNDMKLQRIVWLICPFIVAFNFAILQISRSIFLIRKESVIKKNYDKNKYEI